jgi:hypothetical protein
MMNLKFEKLTVSNAGLSRMIKDKQDLIKKACEFLNKFSEDENGNMSDETYLMMQSLDVDQRTINYLGQLLNENNKVLNRSIIDTYMEVPYAGYGFVPINKVDEQKSFNKEKEKLNELFKRIDYDKLSPAINRKK